MIRREVLRFTDEMERVLKKNDYKGGWQDCDINYLRFRLVEEVGEYFAAQASAADACGDKALADDWREKCRNDIREELVDIANFAMMIWDRS